MREFTQNAILRRLDKKALERLQPSLKKVHLAEKALIYEPDGPMPFVYFPIDGVLSIVWANGGDPVLEVATVGYEGMMGIPLFLGSATHRGYCFAQIPGDSIRLSAAAFQQEINRGGHLHELLHLYTQFLFSQVSQSVICLQMHSVEQRACRWLLMCRERLRRNQFPLTQRFLAQMLGVRRASVNTVAKNLHQKGLLSYSLGYVELLDVEGLKKASCECYENVRNEYRRLLGPTRKRLGVVNGRTTA